MVALQWLDFVVGAVLIWFALVAVACIIVAPFVGVQMFYEKYIKGKLK